MMSDAHAAQAELAQIELLETAERLVRDGMDWRAVLTAFASTAAVIITNRISAAEVPCWFARASAMTMHFSKKDS